MNAMDPSTLCERLRIRADALGRPTDGYSRTAEICRAAAAAAAVHALAIRAAAAAVRSGELELGRTGGNRLVRRLEVSAATFERLAERDEVFANGLEEHALHQSAWTLR
jgi:hypothetical protein